MTVRALRWIVGLGLLAFAAFRVLAIFRIAFNWDELVLFDGVARTLADGLLRSGGRPGLAQLLVMPLVEGCRDEVAVGHAARGLWLGFTLALLAGLYVLLLAVLRGRPGRVHDAAAGVALLALLPVFLEWSVQVRTDQIALCGALWGGVALLHSERRPGLALAAGLAFGLGWLASQKLAYGAALVGLLAAGRLWVTGGLDPTREGWRAVLAAAGFGTVLLGFRAFLMATFTLRETHAARHVLGPTLGSATGTAFPFYRETIGFSQYAELLPTLLPHAALLAGLVAVTATTRAGRRRPACGNRGDRSGRWIDLAWAVALLGVAVALFHAAAFKYFWMTLGLFPAVAGALALGPLRAWIAARRPALVRPAAWALWSALAVPALLSHAALLLHDTQAVQRDSLHFVQRNFPPSHGGFHPEGGRFCASPQPSGVWLSQRIFRQFEHPDQEARARAWIDRFLQAPPRYLLQSFRLNQFPLPLRRFLAEHYQPYRDAVFVAGRRIDLGPDEATAVELIVPGRYRWVPLRSRATDAGNASAGPPALRLDGAPLVPGATRALAPGPHRIGPHPAGVRGLLVLSVDEPPGPAPRAFYAAY